MVEKSFFHLLNICIVNSRVMFTSIAGNKNVSNLSYRDCTWFALGVGMQHVI